MGLTNKCIMHTQYKGSDTNIKVFVTKNKVRFQKICYICNRKRYQNAQ